MDKRTFLKALLAASAAGKGVLAANPKMTNWAGNLEYGTDKVFAAHSANDVREIVRSHSKLKALGSKHCFNNIADSHDGFVSLQAVDDAILIDAVTNTVTVNGGITYGKLSPYLDAKGYALHNLASLPHISVAGSCSTGTHGSGQRNGNLATAVAGFEMVTAAGDVMHFSRSKDGDKFRSAVVGLGALGVITRVTLNVQPTYSMRQYVYEKMPMEQMKNHFDAIEGSAYSVSLFTDWQKPYLNEVWVKCRVEDGAIYNGPEEFFGAKRATKNLHPIAELSAENCTGQMGVPGPWYERLPHFRIGFTPSAGKELQSEYYVPRKHAVEAIQAVARLRDQIGPHLMISEIRTIAADDLWMSPCYKQDSVTLHFTWKQDWPAVSKLLPVIERELSPFSPRPHWGKLFTMAPAQLRASYERMPEFIALSNKLDPTGKFRNEFLNKNLFGT